LQDYYIKREKDILDSVRPNSTAMYWWNGGGVKYGKGDILQVWAGSDNFTQIMEKYPEQNIVHSFMSPYYLDCGFINQYGSMSWCGAHHTWKDIYMVDPTKLHTPELKSRFLGAELPLWSEMNNEFNLNLKIFPRAGAMSFRYWNPQSPQNLAKIAEIMIKYQFRLKNYDVPSMRVTQRYCEKHTNHCFGNEEIH
jgi:N-acetyl-beta-hexosaminidase